MFYYAVNQNPNSFRASIENLFYFSTLDGQKLKYVLRNSKEAKTCFASHFKTHFILSTFLENAGEFFYCIKIEKVFFSILEYECFVNIA